MNILGQSFDAWVTKQINFRQASLKRGSGKNADDLKYQQSKINVPKNQVVMDN